MSIRLGQQAPAFSARDRQASLVSLADCAGRKRLLLFVRYAFGGLHDNVSGIDN
jgi:peroxiredoxin